MSHHHNSEERLTHAVNTLIERIDHMALVWERLEAKVAALKTVEDSLIALLTNFAQAVKDAVQNAKDLAEAQAHIEVLDGELQAQTDALSAALVANTPAGPATPPPVVTDPSTGQPVDPNAPVNDPNVPSGMRRRR